MVPGFSDSVRRGGRGRPSQCWRWLWMVTFALACGQAAARVPLETIEQAVFTDSRAALQQAQQGLKTATDPEARLDLIRQAVWSLLFENLDGAAALVKEGLALAQALNAHDAMCEMLLAQSDLVAPFERPSAEADALLLKAQRLAEEHGLARQLSWLLAGRGVRSSRAFRYVEAYELLIRSHAIAEGQHNIFAMAYALVWMANVESRPGTGAPGAEQALAHYRQAAELVDLAPYKSMGALTVGAWAEALAERGDFAEAQRQYERTIAAVGTQGSPTQLGSLHQKLAQMQLAQGQPAKALETVAKVRRISRIAAEWGASSLALLQARALAATGQASEAQAALKEAEQLARANGRPQAMARVHEAAAEVEAKAGRFEQAHAHLVELRRIEAETTDKVNDRLISELNTKFDVERREHEAALAQASARESDLQRRSLAAVLAGAVVLAAVMGVLLRMQFVQRRKLARVSNELANRNEALEDLNTKRTRLLAAACHDLRQPAHALGMLVESFSSTEGPVPLENRLASIRRCCASLCDMLSMLMDLHRLEQGHYAAEVGQVALDTVLEEVELHFTLAAVQKGLSLKVGRCGAIVRTDPNLVRRIAFNLVSNAIKYTARGGVRVEAEIRGGMVRLRVTDTGIGIPPERMDDVFTEYVRLDSARSAEGLGIGLAIVKRAADLIGHRLQVASAVGQGTTLSIDLPLDIGPPPAPPDAAPPEPAARPRPGQVIAIVENDRECRDALHGLLASWGYTVVSGRDSDSLAANLPPGATPSLVISDLHLGTEDGFGAIAALRRRAGNEGLRAMLLTGDLDAEVAMQAERAQVTLLHKPVQARRLRAIIGAAMDAG